MAGANKQVKAKARNISGTKTATDMEKRRSTPKITGNKIAKPNGLVMARNNDVAAQKMKTPARKAVENGGVDITGAIARKKNATKKTSSMRTATPRSTMSRTSTPRATGNKVSKPLTNGTKAAPKTNTTKTNTAKEKVDTFVNDMKLFDEWAVENSKKKAAERKATRKKKAAERKEKVDGFVNSMKLADEYIAETRKKKAAERKAKKKK